MICPVLELYDHMGGFYFVIEMTSPKTTGFVLLGFVVTIPVL